MSVKPPVDRLALARTSGLRRQHRGRLKPVVPIPAGTSIAGKYRIETLLGEGGMGAVYRAEHVIMQRPIALKVMRPEMLEDPKMTARFTREAQAASRIASRHVVTIHDFGQAEDGLLYLVMELLQGEALSSRLESDGLLPWADAVSVAIQMSEALSVAHGADVVHRDLKPDNVFLCRDGTVKVLDFGIARILPRDDSGNLADARLITHAGSIVGTPLYMSPEAAAHRPVGPPADLYALGAILFEMVTGRMVFEDEHVVLLLGAHLTRKPPRIREVRPELGLPPALDDLVDRLLAKDPKARPPTADAVASELRAILSAAGLKPSSVAGRFSSQEIVVRRAAVASEAATLAAEGPRTIAQDDDEVATATTDRPPPADAAAVLADARATPAGAPRTSTPQPTIGATPEPQRRAESANDGGVEAEPAMTARPAARSRVATFAMGALALAAGGFLIFLGSGDAPSEPPASASPTPTVASPSRAPEPDVEPEREPVARAEPTSVELTIVATPAAATITVDGAPVTGGRTELPRDRAAHEIVVSAEGYAARTLNVTADRDREIVLDLERAPRARPTRRERAPTGTPTTTTTPAPERPRHIVGEF